MVTQRVLVQMNGLGLGGTEINAIQFAAQVREHGFESVLVAPSDTEPSGPSARDVAADYDLELRTFERPSRVVAGAKALSALADDVRADIVHVYGQATTRPAYLGPCRYGRRPLVVTAYEMDVHPLTPRGPSLVVGTRYLAEDLAERGKVTLISPPVDVRSDRADLEAAARFRAATGTDHSARLVVWVGRLDAAMKEPAVTTLIDAMGLLDQPDVVLVVAGTGDAEDRLRARAQEVDRRLGRRAVLFTGALADPHDAYAAADVHVGMGSSAARGLAFGAPLVVVSETGWARTFSEESASALFRNSFWSPETYDDAPAVLAGELRALLADPAAAARLGAFGREFATTHFGLPAMGARLADLYARSSADYGWRGWLQDLDLELYAGYDRLRHRVSSAPGQMSHGGYRFSSETVLPMRDRWGRLISPLTDRRTRASRPRRVERAGWADGRG